MFTVLLQRISSGAIKEEYGRIVFDNGRIKYEGLTTVFIKSLERGITGEDKRTYTPVNGLEFMKNLKFEPALEPLSIEEMTQTQ